MMNGCPRWSFLTVPLLAALGCSDPVPRPSQGGLTLSVQKLGSPTCPVPGKIYVVGDPDGPDSNTIGDPLVDGEKGATIKCSVKGNGPYTFSGSIYSDVSKLTWSLTGGTVNADKATGTATASVYTADLAGTFSSAAAACTVTVLKQQIKPGSMWATISCPTIKNSSTSQECSVGTTTTFVLENCEGS